MSKPSAGLAEDWVTVDVTVDSRLFASGEPDTDGGAPSGAAEAGAGPRREPASERRPESDPWPLRAGSWLLSKFMYVLLQSGWVLSGFLAVIHDHLTRQD